MSRVCFAVVLNVSLLKKKYLKFTATIVLHNVHVCTLLCNMHTFDLQLNLVFFCITFFLGDRVVCDSMYSIRLLSNYLDDGMLARSLGVHCNERLSSAGSSTGRADMKLLFGMVQYVVVVLAIYLYKICSKYIISR